MDEIKSLDTLQHSTWNPRRISKDDFNALVKSMELFGDLSGIIKNIETGTLVGGNQRLEALKKFPNAKIEITRKFSDGPEHNKGTIALGYVVLGDGTTFSYREVMWPLEKEKAANVAANRIQGEFDLDKLAELNYELSLLPNADELLKATGQSIEEIKRLINMVSGEEAEPKGNLVDDFIVPPFSILDTKQGYWQDRKRSWLDLGIKSEVGRDQSLLTGESGILNAINNGTSVFDPVLCEIAYRWFNVDKGNVLDPFAGGSVRGVVASRLGMQYVGVELRGDQVEANRTQATSICDDPLPTWIEGDSLNIKDLVGDYRADLVFSCPPYADLEVYSDDARDLSNMEYEKFCGIYWDIIRNACDLLKDDRFAVFVVGEVRGKKGDYYNFVGDTINAFRDAGLTYYNEMILVNTAGSLPLRAAKQFNASRKIGKQHQNVLVFYKGNTKDIKINFNELDFSKLEDSLTDKIDSPVG